MEKLSTAKRKRWLGSKEPNILFKMTCNKECLEFNPRKWVVGAIFKEKYISLDIVEEWIINPRKQVHNASSVWKIVNSPFHLVGN